MEGAKLTDPENKLEVLFLIIIVLALIKRFTVSLFKLLRLPFKIAFIFYNLKYFDYYFSYVFNTLNTLSLSIIDLFYLKITNFFIKFIQIMVIIKILVFSMSRFLVFKQLKKK